jgi:endonuclease G
MKKIFSILFYILLISCKKEPDIQLSNTSLEPISKGEIVKHAYYTLAYSEADEQAYWVYYHLTPELINGTQSRTDDFRPDPLVISGSASLAYYSGSGYDRGHLCPAADMTLNKTSMSESFFLSNMSPQNASFNRGIWSALEERVRKWVTEYGDLYVCVGGVLNENLGTIGTNKVTVPKSYYKIVYSEKEGMIGFILPNQGSSLTLDKFVVTVDEIEKQTGIDFFSGLDDKIETQLESSISTTNWNFK